jgi:hypothetical protein
MNYLYAFHEFCIQRVGLEHRVIILHQLIEVANIPAYVTWEKYNRTKVWSISSTNTFLMRSAATGFYSQCCASVSPREVFIY